MDPDFKPTISEAHPETMDFLSRAWCNFAVQAIQPELQDQSVVILDNPIKKFGNDTKAPFPVSWITVVLDRYFMYFILWTEIKYMKLQKIDNSVKMDDAGIKSPPPWKTNDVKVIWLPTNNHIFKLRHPKFIINLPSFFFLVLFFSFSRGYGCSRQCIQNWTTTAISERNGYIIFHWSPYVFSLVHNFILPDVWFIWSYFAQKYYKTFSCRFHGK